MVGLAWENDSALRISQTSQWWRVMLSVASDKPLVSIVTIFYDAKQFVGEAIESVLGQTYSDWELLLVDDGSSDGSSRIAQGYAEEHPDRIRYLEHPGHVNRGMSASRNVGIGHARGALIAFLDADDVWLPHKLEKQVAIMAEQPEAAAISGPTRFWYGWTGLPEDGRRDSLRIVSQPGDVLYRPPELLRRFLQNRARTPATCSVMIRRKAFEQTGGFEEQFRGLYEDQAFFLKVFLALPIYLTTACTDLYRQHAGSHVSEALRTGRYFDDKPGPAFVALLLWLTRYLAQKRITDLAIWTSLVKNLLGSGLQVSMMKLNGLYPIAPASIAAQLGVETAWLDDFIASICERLRCSPEVARHNQRKGTLLYAIVSGGNVDASVDETEWAIRTLFELYDEICRRLSLDFATAKQVRTKLQRDTARTLCWMGHHYPDRAEHSQARGMLWIASRMFPRSVLTFEGLGLVVKLIGGRPIVWVVRRLSRKRPTASASGC